MPRGPGVREIFSSKSMGKGSIDKQESKLQRQVSAEDGNGQSQMKRFGGYKPKILGGENDFLNTPDTNPADALSSLVSSNLGPEHRQPTVKALPVSPKPWIIGDKNIPMVLGTTNDGDDDNADSIGNNNNTEHHNLDSHSSFYIDSDSSDLVNGSVASLSISSDTSALILQQSNQSMQGIENRALNISSSISVDESFETQAQPDTIPQPETTDFPDYKMNGVHDQGRVTDEPEGVYIPAPDYDEEEKTLDFNSEDTEDHIDSGEDRKQRQAKAKSAIKVYEGADLSHYLSEDDSLQPEVTLRNDQRAKNTLGSRNKSGASKTKSLFKQNSNNRNKRKSSGNFHTSNSVRSFSYADSKFGTKGKSMNKSLSASNLTDECEIFLSANTEQSSYESFLRSRHGDQLPGESNNNDAGGGVHEDFGESSVLKHKDDPLWKKLTMRLKNRVSKTSITKDP